MRTPSPRVGPSTGTPAAASSPSVSRRRFLFALSAGGAGAAAAVAAPALATSAAGNDVVAAPATSGYRETDHVRDYYATTRL
jgi:hypothetical protein